MDISSDLVALSRYDVMVVCSGVKSFLDIGRSLELLETLGVPVLRYGTGDFPGFFVRSTGFPVPYRVDAPEEVVAFARLKWGEGWRGGILVANPVPREEAGDDALIARAIEEAQRLAMERGVSAGRSRNVGASDRPRAPAPPGHVVSFVDAQGERTMFSYGGAAATPLELTESRRAAIAGASLLFLSGYGLRAPDQAASYLAAARLAREHGMPVAFDPSPAWA
ncbi:hypothetical protein LIP_0492 [Limnochorda pilosa]|uniref:Uncharacterized protein n=1 Tax=Limnochorda pilosa TaxID=1555112 RepID=A0A0K2SHP2_LIMPI|nr:hypothetical protein LIP_0492 [Limnochorda pilosa]